MIISFLEICRKLLKKIIDKTIAAIPNLTVIRKKGGIVSHIFRETNPNPQRTVTVSSPMMGKILECEVFSLSVWWLFVIFLSLDATTGTHSGPRF